MDALTGSHIVTEGYLASIPLNTLTNTISGYTDTQLKAFAVEAEKLVGSSFSDPLALAQQVYGNSVLSDYTAKTVLSTLIDKTNDTLHTDTSLSNLVVPDLYGGLDIKDGFIDDVKRTRLVTESYLVSGDVIVAEYDNIYEVFVYLGNGKLAKVSSADGICTLVTSSGEAYSGTNIFATFITYDRYVILRPSLVG